VNGKYTVTEVILKPKIVIPFSQKPDRAKHVLEMSEKSCLISNAIKVPIRFEPEIFIEHSIIPLGEPF
jgi:organic hydroperoxide reductase OsmC/OhrA